MVSAWLAIRFSLQFIVKANASEAINRDIIGSSSLRQLRPRQLIVKASASETVNRYIIGS